MSDRGREKHLTSPDGDKKKRGSLFRRPSLSRKKTKDAVFLESTAFFCTKFGALNEFYEQ